MQLLTEQVQKEGGEGEKLHISRSPKGARLLSHSCDIITTTTPGVSLADWQQALQRKPHGNEHSASSLYTDSYFTGVLGRVVRDGAMPGCVNIYTALGSIAPPANTTERTLKTEYLEF